MLNKPLIVSFERCDMAGVELLGAKGANLAEDFRRVRGIIPGMEGKIAVPDGFILTTRAWRTFNSNGGRLPDELFGSVLSELISLERRTGHRVGDLSGAMPLFVAVRGGAPVSLPGALATVLNVGFNDEVVSALLSAGENEAFVLTSYLTAIRMYGEVVLDIPYGKFYRIIEGAGEEGSITVPMLRELIGRFKEVLDEARHPRFPSGFEDRPDRQLRYCIEAVLGSWMAPVAVEARQSRRKIAPIPDSMGTAAIVQQMVFGNRDRKCLSGVLFTREQRTGANHPIIEWAPNVQCDKIVSGKLRKKLLHAADLAKLNPGIYQRLLMVRDAMEARARRPLDIEFTVENDRLFLLQRRPMRMTSTATVRAMWDFIDEGKTSIQLASMVINRALGLPEKVLREDFKDYTVLVSGQPITDSADTGILVFGSEAAMEHAERGENVILLRKRPYGEIDVAVNHPRVRGIIRVDGSATGHEAVSAVAYSKPYLINAKDASGKPLLMTQGDDVALNPESSVCRYLGKKVFVDGERGILATTEASGFIEDRRTRKKLYVDWEYLKEQFEACAYANRDYADLIDVHCDWEIQLDAFHRMEKELAASVEMAKEELLHTFDTWLRCFRPADRVKAMKLREVGAEDFDLGPPLAYSGKNLGAEVLKVVRTLMLSTTWWTHWIHEILVEKARARGETENDVIRDISLKNRTMSLLRDFEKEGFHLMKTPGYSHLILASNFEYEQDPERLHVGPGALNYKEKELLARHFMHYLGAVNPPLARVTRMIQGEPPMGQGHARIVSIGLAIPQDEFSLVCRYLRVFLDQYRRGCPIDLPGMVPETGSIELYQIDPFFAPFPDFRVTREFYGSDARNDLFLSFGGCSYGEFEGEVFGKEEFDRLSSRVQKFGGYWAKRGLDQVFRPWFFEIDPYRRHSLIAAVGIRFDKSHFSRVLEELKQFMSPRARQAR